MSLEKKRQAAIKRPPVRLPGFMKGKKQKGWYREIYEGEDVPVGTPINTQNNGKRYRQLPESEWGDLDAMEQMEKDKKNKYTRLIF